MQPFVWTLGGLIGSALGGYLAQPAVYYPNIFPAGGLFDKYPYLLANLASFVIVAISIIQGLLLLDETNIDLIKKRNKAAKYDDCDTDVEDETSPLNPNKRNVTLSRTVSDESTPLISEDSAFGTISRSSDTLASSASSQTIAEDSGDYEGPIWNKTIIMIVLALFIFSYHQMAFVTLIPIHVVDKPKAPVGHLDLFGGFGLSLHDVSTFLATEGGSSLVIQAFVFPFILKTVGVWWSFVSMACLYPVCYFIMPFLWTAPKFLRAGVVIALILQAFIGIVINAPLLILLKNACPDRRALGRVVGLGMSACCLARTIAPPLAGVIYDNFGSGMAWFSCGFVAFLGIIEMLFVPREQLKKPIDDDDIIVGGH